MPRKSLIDELPADQTAKPAEIEIVAPDPNVEAQVAQQSMQNRRLAEQRMMGRQVVPPTIPPSRPQTRNTEPEPQPASTFAPPVNIVPKPPQADSELARAATMVVEKLCSLSHEWGAKIDAMRVERHMTDDQIAFALIANTLNMDLHMQVPGDHPYFAEGFQPAGTNFECIICGSVNSRLYPGMPPVCPEADKKCARQFRGLPQDEQKELLEAAQ